MARVYVWNLDERVSERDIEDEFRSYGTLKRVYVARCPPGYAILEFDHLRDAEAAIRSVDGKYGWVVQLSYNSMMGGGGGRDGGGRGSRDGGGEEEEAEAKPEIQTRGALSII